MGVNSLPKTVTRQRRGCYLNLGHSAPESSTLTTRLPSHPMFTTEILNACVSLINRFIQSWIVDYCRILRYQFTTLPSFCLCSQASSVCVVSRIIFAPTFAGKMSSTTENCQAEFYAIIVHVYAQLPNFIQLSLTLRSYLILRILFYSRFVHCWTNNEWMNGTV